MINIDALFDKVMSEKLSLLAFSVICAKRNYGKISVRTLCRISGIGKLKARNAMREAEAFLLEPGELIEPTPKAIPLQHTKVKISPPRKLAKADIEDWLNDATTQRSSVEADGEEVAATPYGSSSRQQIRLGEDAGGFKPASIEDGVRGLDPELDEMRKNYTLMEDSDALEWAARLRKKRKDNADKKIQASKAQ